MSMGNSTPDSRVTSFVDAVERHWTTGGMPSSTRRRLAVQLEQDLAEALANGASHDELLRDDPREFAERLAAAHDVGLTLGEPPEMTTRALVLTGLAGGGAGAVVAYLLVYAGLAMYFVGPATGGVSEMVTIGIMHGLAAAITLSGILGAMWYRFRHEPSIKAIITASGFLVAVAGAASVAPIMVVAAASNFSTAAIVVLLEAGIAAAFCALAIVLAQRLVTHRSH